MAFIFSTSHLPETRLRRPDHLEEDDDEDSLSPPPRAGGVRAFSHLPEPRPQADRSGPLSTRPTIPVGRPRPYADPEADENRDTDHAAGPDSYQDDDDAPRAHDAYADDAPWHSPRITPRVLPPQSHDEDEYAPGPRSARDSSFDDTPPAGRSASRYPDTGSFHRPQDIRSDFHSPSAPDSSASLFEKHLPPDFHQPSGQLQLLADRAAYHDLVHRAGGGAENAHDQHGGFFQNMADTRGTRQAQTSSPSRPPSGAPQTFAQSVQPAAQPQAQNSSAATGGKSCSECACCIKAPGTRPTQT